MVAGESKFSIIAVILIDHFYDFGYEVYEHK